MAIVGWRAGVWPLTRSGEPPRWLLIVAGLATLSWAGVAWARADHERAARAKALPVILHVGIPDSGRTLGLLQVPRLGLSTVVLEGDDFSSLMVGAAHLPETPLPGTAATACSQATGTRISGRSGGSEKGT